MRICILLVLALAGCGRHLPECISDLGAGATAYHQETDPARKATIADGLAAGILGVTSHIPALPDPEMSPEAIRSDPSSYRDAMMDVQADPPQYELPAPPPPSPVDQLTQIGSTMVFWGGILGAVALVFLIVSCTPWGAVLLPFVGIIRMAVSAGTASAIVGAAMVWLAPYLWWVVALCVIGVAYYHRKGLMKYLKRLRRGA